MAGGRRPSRRNGSKNRSIWPISWISTGTSLMIFREVLEPQCAAPAALSSTPYGGPRLHIPDAGSQNSVHFGLNRPMLRQLLF